MIRYSLRCAEGHNFDSWFQSAEAFDKLTGSGMLTCAVCGGGGVQKSLMAPKVRPARKAAVPAVSERPLAAPASEIEAALRKLRRHVEENSDYVGLEFVTEARAIHDGEAPARPIYGEARLDEARKLIEDGVPVAPLPFTPKRKTN